MGKFYLLCGFTVVSLASYFISTAFSITVDEFNDSQYLESTSSTPLNSSALIPLSALGGVRKFTTQVTPPFPPGLAKVSLEAIGGFLLHSQSSGARGKSLVTWDGYGLTLATKSDGLPAIDFFQDLGTRFIVDTVSFDPGIGGLPLNLIMRVYDAIDSSGNTYSQAIKTINATFINGIEFIYASGMSDFTVHGLNGPADFSRVGAIELLIDGSGDPAIDIDLGGIKTDGYCEMIPDSQGRVVDECGVCAGDNSSCAGCDGHPNSGLVIDNCGVCGGDGKSCITCQEVNIFETQGQLDGLAKEQEFVVRAALKLLLKASKLHGVSYDDYIANNKAEARALQISNWVLSWTMPTHMNLCTNAEVCVTSSNEEILQTYRDQALKLKKIAVQAAKKVKKVSGKTYIGKVKEYRKAAITVYNEALKLSNTVPLLNYSCS